MRFAAAVVELEVLGRRDRDAVASIGVRGSIYLGGMSLHPDAFNMGVFLNLVMMQSDALWRSHRQNSTDPIDEDTAHAIAERAYAIVVNNFVVFDDDDGTLSRAFEKPRATVVARVADALVGATAAIAEPVG